MIEVYCLANNEEQLMPYFMRHYSQFANVILLESNSTDRTIEIAHSLGATIWTYDVPDEINDEWITYLKNNCWKDSLADWVMIVDSDEFIYHPDLINKLKNSKATIIQPRFYNMYSNKFPTTKGQIYEEVTLGIEQTQPKAKMNIFRPRIGNINYLPGCHEAFPLGKFILDTESGIMTLHMRNLSKEFIRKRNERHSMRRSAINKEHGWGDHVDFPIEDVLKQFDEAILRATKII